METDSVHVKPKKKAKAKSKGVGSGKGKGSGDGAVFREVPDPANVAPQQQRQQATTAEGVTSVIDRMLAAGTAYLAPSGILPNAASALLGNTIEGDELEKVIRPPGLDQTVEFDYGPPQPKAPGVDHTAEFELKPFSQHSEYVPIILTDPPNITSDPLDLEIAMPTKYYDIGTSSENPKKPPSETESNVSSAYGPAPRTLGYQRVPYARATGSEEPLVTSVPRVPSQIAQHAIDVSHQANLRAQQSFDLAAQAAEHIGAHVAATSQHVSIQVAAMAALGSAVQETMGHQSESKVRITAIESNAATVSQLQAVELRANRLEAQLDILGGRISRGKCTHSLCQPCDGRGHSSN